MSILMKSTLGIRCDGISIRPIWRLADRLSIGLQFEAAEARGLLIIEVRDHERPPSCGLQPHEWRGHSSNYLT
jgi:hypothetical protein